MVQKMDWLTLLCDERLGDSRSNVSHGHGRDSFQRDFDTIIFSSAFRRLQDKTQVFPLAKNDYVRTRLTHSLEVSSVGRSLGNMVGAEILKQTKNPQLKKYEASDFGSIVAAACLIHDIGNPPFGHTGEDAIQEWFRTSPKAAPIFKALPKEGHDFLRFEGNAQGLRIVTNLHDPLNHGMRLSCASLAASIKYPQTAAQRAAQKEKPKAASRKKHNFFYAQERTFEEIARRCGLISVPDSKGNNYWRRHPLAFLVEAADDICYHIIDIEDGFRTHCLEYEDVCRILFNLANAGLKKPASPKQHVSITDRLARERMVTRLRGEAINNCIHRCVETFLLHETKLLTGEFDTPLIDADNVLCHAMDSCTEMCVRLVYPSRAVAAVETMGYRVLWELLDLFVPAVTAKHLSDAKNYKPSLKDTTLLYLLPQQFRDKETIYESVLGVTDFISGMTDSYAMGVYKEVMGIGS